MSNNHSPKIKIIKDGPYIVTGKVPLGEKVILSNEEGSEFIEGRKFPQSEEYALCRCGKSKNPPFCDGSHVSSNFIGTETASKLRYEDRAALQKGSSIDLYDDDRCAYARFCHGKNGSTWDLVEESHDEENKKEAIRTASNCPAGRLTAVDKNGEIIEPPYEPAIEILQDPDNNASAGIFIKGMIPLESADGALYETRNRYVLCRCGASKNKPFCDATHIDVGYSDDNRK
ncbi:iron-binding zinc finger CDGSH type [Oxobacter pfennigii]|uniref:Iron-binding zinc finger CDGSH type n=1 Tax=Oxobacter pfennigii TaxID=36849 RepID=A0A0P8WYP9_9CLOT|nr:CDGSH iron-sulfur domain-containing protein [Oxobacter pfennigii]KPU43551.1 iron-binding zinc finger CDGSH type [Oxobacter pfennigii]